MEANVVDEEEIVWLQSPERYAYLRENVMDFSQRRCFPKRLRPGGANTGAPNTHLVAYAVLKPRAASCRGWFPRRYWWVKKHDRFEGHGLDSASTFYEHGGPVEAVQVESIKAGQSSTPGWK